MEYSIEKMAETLRLPVEEVRRALREGGLPTDGMTTVDPERFRTALVRYYGARLEQVSRAALPEREPVAEKMPATAIASSTVDPVLDKLVAEKLIMIDTCTLMHEGSPVLIGKLIPALQKHGKAVVIPQHVIAELNRHRFRKKDRHKAGCGAQGYRLCLDLQNAGCLSVRGSRLDNFADNVFYVLFSRYRYRHRLLLITQDRKLTGDILQLNRTQSSAGLPVAVMWMDDQGELHEGEA